MAQRLLSIDTETFSTVPIEAGMARYWEGAGVLCINWGLAGSPVRGLITKTYVPCPPDLKALLEDPEVIISGWNVKFDWCALQWLADNYGWPRVPFSRTTCTMVRAAMAALPQALGQCAPVIMPDLAKDYAGAALMMKMCKPPSKPPAEITKPLVKAIPVAERLRRRMAAMEEQAEAIWAKDPRSLQPVADHSPANLAALSDYCRTDVHCEARIAKSPRLPQIPASEEVLRQLDHTINARGVRIDLDLARAMVELLKPYRESAEDELYEITGGAVETAKQTQAIRGWLSKHGLQLPNLTSETIDMVMDHEKYDTLVPEVQRVIEIRSSLALSSLSKIDTALEYVCKDERMRDMLRFYRAHTGRWAGAGYQPQNLPRPVERVVNAEGKMVKTALSRGSAGLAIDMIKHRDAVGLTGLFSDDIPRIVSACLRGLFIADEGKTLIGADFSQIECRVLAWAAGQKDLIERFKTGGKVYEARAAQVYQRAIETITKDSQERQVGKFVELGCGYQMGPDAFKRQLKKATGIVVTAEFARTVIDRYRVTSPAIVNWWGRLNEAAMSAVRNPGTVYEAGPVAFHFDSAIGWLRMRLPSGRCLHYQQAGIGPNPKFGNDSVFFFGVDRWTHKWEQQWMYGGMLAENAVQAISRDLMAAGMLAAEADGFPLILTIHDELLAEVEPQGHVTDEIKSFEHCLVGHAPAWAKNIPLKAEGWAATRYHK